METFTDLKNFVPNPHFDSQRRQVLDGLQLEFIDAPLVGLIRDLARLPDCFSLQCCYGHFLYDGQQDEHHIGRLPLEAPSAELEYRIAYLAICLREGEQGRALFRELSKLPVLEPNTSSSAVPGGFGSGR